MQAKGSKKERRKATDKAIIEAAVKEFSEKGYSRARVVSIAKRAGISQGLVSQNFGNKERLFMTTTSLVDSDCFSPDTDADTVPEILYKVIDAWKNIYKEQPTHFQLLYMLTHVIDFPEIIAKGVEARFKLSPVYAAIEKAQAAGDFPQGDVLGIMRDLFQITVPMIYYYNKAGVELPENELFLRLVGYKPKKA